MGGIVALVKGGCVGYTGNCFRVTSMPSNALALEEAEEEDAITPFVRTLLEGVSPASVSLLQRVQVSGCEGMTAPSLEGPAFMGHSVSIRVRRDAVRGDLLHKIGMDACLTHPLSAASWGVTSSSESEKVMHMSSKLLMLVSVDPSG